MAEKRVPGSEKTQAVVAQPAKKSGAPAEPGKMPKPLRLGKDCDYEQELGRLQIELVKLHEWIRHEGLKVVILFEGRDAAGKGATPPGRAAPSSASRRR
jgi:polyphosphate kinase